MLHIYLCLEFTDSRVGHGIERKGRMDDSWLEADGDVFKRQCTWGPKEQRHTRRGLAPVLR